MVIGHEHIAAGRKIDAGRYFDWLRLYDETYRPGIKSLTPEEKLLIPEPEIEPQPTKLTPGKDSFIDLVLSFFRKN